MPRPSRQRTSSPVSEDQEPPGLFQEQADAVPPSPSWTSLCRQLHQTHLCFSSAAIPCLLLATIILLVLAVKYEHLAEPAEVALNTTLLLLKAKSL